MNKSWVLVLCLTFPGILKADSSQQLWERLSAIHTLQAVFIQTTLSPNGKSLQSSDGQLRVGGDAKFRIETYQPYPQTLVSNGQDFWSYDPDLAQVVVSKLNLDINKVPILLFGSQDKSLLDTYNVSRYETEELGKQVLEKYILAPKANDSLFELLTVTFRGNVPISISLKDTLSQKTHLQLSDIEVNKKLDPEIFNFTVPTGIDVIDERLR